MNVLVIGSGGREHALAWKLAQSPRVKVVYVAPGNGGTANTPKLENVPITDFSELADFCVKQNVKLTVVGPDAALAEGVVNLFQSKGLKIFGPTKEAAEIEWSKSFSKAFMKRHNIPTAAYETFTDAAQAHQYIDTQTMPIVIKADGLAAGKGVIIASSKEQAHAAIDSMMLDNRFGGSGSRVVIEEFMHGEEASFFVVSDGNEFITFSTAQDHKRLGDGDTGPNTGGMGAYTPASLVTPEIQAKVLKKIVRPTLNGLASEGRAFQGFLYVGLMIGDDGDPRVVEYNARMGDPETQPIVMRLKSDLFPILLLAAEGKLNKDMSLEWDRRSALTVILASQGYPDAPRKGDIIKGLAQSSPEPSHVEAMVFHAGTQWVDGVLQTNGGRVLCVTAMADSLKQAQQQAYEAVSHIQFNGMQFRHDIGNKGITQHG